MSATSAEPATEKKAVRGVDMEKEAGRRREAAVTLRQKKKEELLREKRRGGRYSVLRPLSSRRRWSLLV